MLVCVRINMYIYIHTYAYVSGIDTVICRCTNHRCVDLDFRPGLQYARTDSEACYIKGKAEPETILQIPGRRIETSARNPGSSLHIINVGVSDYRGP